MQVDFFISFFVYKFKSNVYLCNLNLPFIHLKQNNENLIIASYFFHHGKKESFLLRNPLFSQLLFLLQKIKSIRPCLGLNNEYSMYYIF